VPRHVTEALTTPHRGVVSLLNAGHVFFYGGFPQHVEASEYTLVGEMKPAVAVAAVLLDGLFLGTVLGNMSLIVTVVAEAVAASAL